MARIKLTILLLFICSVSFGQLKNGVAGFWKGEDNRDEKGLNDATLFSVSIVTGKVGNAWDFNGTTSKAETGITTNYAQLSIVIWAYRTGAGENANGRLIDKSGQIACYGIVDNVAFLHTNTGALGQWVTNTDVWTANTWHHIVVTYDNTSTSNVPVMYVDGVSQSITVLSTPTGTPTANANEFVIGNNDVTQRTFDGVLDEVFLYGIIVNQNFVSQHYANDNGRLYVWMNFLNSGNYDELSNWNLLNLYTKLKS